MKSAALLVIAMSARAYVMAAKQAGYTVTAIDGFADQETVLQADLTMTVECSAFGFNAEALIHAVEKLAASEYLGFVYGSGFEAQPALLEAIGRMIPIIGNSAQTLAAVKNKQQFFATLTQCDVKYPQVFDTMPEGRMPNPMLLKHAGGCGGGHIQYAENVKLLNSNEYYQEYIEGQSVSILFLANARLANASQVESPVLLIGFNEQWTSPDDRHLFRYGGAVSHIALLPAVQQQLVLAAEKLTQAFALNGLNSLDAIVRNGMVYVLEVNPRLSATFDLYAEDWLNNGCVNLLNLHIAVCLNAENAQYLYKKAKEFEQLMHAEEGGQLHRAQAVVYAVQDCAMHDAFDFFMQCPEWVVDRPNVSVHDQVVYFEQGAPICSVLAHAESAELAKIAVNNRVNAIQLKLQ